MESMPSATQHERFLRASEMRESKMEGRTVRINGANGSTIPAPLAIRPFQQYRNMHDESEGRLSIVQRPVMSRMSNASAGTRKTFKSYTISEILKTNEANNDEFDDDNRKNSLERHCYTTSRESLGREQASCYDVDGPQQCTTCCQCYSAVRYPYSMPYRSWQITGEREAFLCGYPTTGMFHGITSYSSL